MPNVGLGLSPTAHSTQRDPAGRISVAIIQFNGYGLCCETLLLPNTGIFMGWEQTCTEFEINKQSRLLLISVKKKRGGVKIQTSTQSGILFIKSLYHQSEVDWEWITAPVNVHRAAPVCKSNADVGANHTLVKGFRDISVGWLWAILKQSQSHHQLLQDRCCLRCMGAGRRQSQRWVLLSRASGERNDTVPSTPADRGCLGSLALLGETGRGWWAVLLSRLSHGALGL